MRLLHRKHNLVTAFKRCPCCNHGFGHEHTRFFRKIRQFDILEFPVGKPEDVLRHLMQEHGVSQTNLEREGIASQSQLSNILAGRREISKGLAKRLAVRFGVPLEMLL